MQSKDLTEGVEDLGTMSDINVTPFIDVMLVLLIIFMVTAPMMMGGVGVNLPKSSGEPMHQPDVKPLVVSLDANNNIFAGSDELPLTGRHAIFQRMARESATGEVLIHGDKEVKYGRMMALMAELGKAGFARVTLVTDIRSGSNKIEQDK